MTDDITPDRLRMAGWDDDRGGIFTRPGDGPPWIYKAASGEWYFEVSHLLENGRDSVVLTGMADIAARVAAFTDRED